MYGAAMCGLRELTPEQRRDEENTVKNTGKAAFTIASFFAAPELLGLRLGEMLGIVKTVSVVERANIAAASFKALAEKAGTSLPGVGEMVGWGGGRSAAAQAAARTAEIDRDAVAGMRGSGLTKGLATGARDMYKAAAETGRKGGEVAVERYKLMEKILKNW